MRTIKRVDLFLFVFLSLFLSVQVYGAQRFRVSAKGVDKRVCHSDKELLLEFTHQLDPNSISETIVLRDNSGSLEANYSLEMYKADKKEKTVWLKFNDGFRLKESTKYYIDLKRGLRYVRYITKRGRKIYGRVGRTKTFHFVTTSQSPLSANGGGGRTKLIIVSDIHIGGPRATANGYNWFADNVTEFLKFLEDVSSSQQVKELIINGDLFDEWIMPMDVKPFEAPVTNNTEFFQSVANAPTMKPIINKLNEIADAGDIKVVYIPGNHDMLMTESAMKTIFPNAIWKGHTDTNNIPKGSGYYSPVDGVSIEHGHNYDFFNAPDSLTQSGSLLPPGYFVSRMFATNMVGPPQIEEDLVFSAGNIFFYAAWEIVLWKIFGTIEPNVPSIITGIDGYTKSYTYNEARDIYYDADIAGKWKERQELDGVYSPESEAAALLAGTGVFIWGDLEFAARAQYFIPERAKIVIFGHTHMAMVREYNNYNNEILSTPESRFRIRKQLGPTKKIYANTGTWVNKSLVSKGFPTRSYIVINTNTTDSQLMTVSLYQYNTDGDNNVESESVLLNEKNIHPPPESRRRTLPLIP